MQEQRLIEQWRKRLEGYVPGQQSVREWCAKNGITQDRFYYWRRRLARLPGGQTPRAHTGQWLAVDVVSEKQAQTPANRISVKIAGATIDVEPGFDADLLRAVVHALGVSPC